MLKQTEIHGIQPPVEFVRHNLAITTKHGFRRKCWAAYELAPTHGDYLPASQVFAYHDALTRLFRDLAEVPEAVLAMVPERIRAGDLQENLAYRLAGNLEAQQYVQAVADILRQHEQDHEAVRYRFYLWVRVTPNLGPTEIMEALRGRGPAAALQKLTQGVGITEGSLQAWAEAECALRTRLDGFGASSGLRFTPLQRTEVLERIRAPFWRGIPTTPAASVDWAPGAFLEQRQEGLQMHPNGSLRRFYAGEVDHTNPAFLKVTQTVHGETRSGYQAFLTVERFGPDPLTIPGDEWAYHLQQVGSAELYIRWTGRDYRTTLEALESQRRRQTDTAGQEAEHDGSLSTDTVDGRAETDDMQAYVKATRSPSLLTSVVVAISAPDMPLLRQRIRLATEVFTAINATLTENGTDQARHFYETLLGAPQQVTDYVHPLLPRVLATSMWGLTLELLDPAGSGPYIARDVWGRPLWFDPRRALGRLNVSGNMAFIGPVGSGKSTAMNYLVWIMTLFGAEALLIDSAKPERSRWPEMLPLLGPHTRVVTLSQHEADRGKLDPYAIFPDKAEATNHAISQAAFLTQVKLQDVAYDVLLTAFTHVRDESPTPSMMAGVRQLGILGSDPEYKYKEVATRLAERLYNMSRMAWANLLFGDGSGARIDSSAKITVLQLDRIRRPPEGKRIEDYDVDEYLGHAIMVAATAYAASWARGDRKKQKILAADEIRWFTNNPYGSDLIGQNSLTGRAMGVQVLLAGQNVAHLPVDLRQHFSMRWAFGADNAAEAEANLEFLGAPVSEGMITALMALNPGATKGQALVRDLDGRIGACQVDLVFEDLARAFATQSIEGDA